MAHLHFGPARVPSRESPEEAIAVLQEAAKLYPKNGQIDYLIGESELIGSGIGTRVIAEFVRNLFADYDDVDTIVVDVEHSNVASWRALEKVGFMRVWVGAFPPGRPDGSLSYVYALGRSD